MARIKNTYNSIKRSREIVGVLARHGLGYVFDMPQMEKYLELSNRFFARKKVEPRMERFTLEARVRMALEELGPTFIKLGQVVSTHPDLASPELIAELSKLQDRISPISTEIIKAEIVSGLGRPLEELFLNFNEKPLAAASLSQVHKARLKSGETVAVKVQRPGIREMIENDIIILYELTGVLESKWFRNISYSPKEFVDEFAATIRAELDFSLEAQSAEKFAANFAGSETVHIPVVYGQFTTPNILVTEYIDGVKINRLFRSGTDHDGHAVASSGMDMVLKQIFEDGFFHGDLHPGNVFVLPGDVIALIDFGMVGRIDPETMNELAYVLMSLTKFKTDGIIRGLEKMDIISPDTETRQIKKELNRLIDRYYGLDLKDLQLDKILQDVLEVIRRNRIRIPSEFALLFKTLMMAEGIARRLDPNFNMVEHIQPFVEKLVRKKYSPEKLIREGFGLVEDSLETVRGLPDNVDWLFKSLKQGKLYIGLEHRGLEKMDSTIDRASNRVAFSLIISSLIVGSSFIMGVDRGPYLFGYPFLGILGYLFAAVLGIGLVISIIRGGHI
jgi:ubiquinone biosynthesis protein